MAETRRCPECGSEVGTEAAVCPNCGYPFTEGEAGAAAEQAAPGPAKQKIGGKTIGIVLFLAAAILLIVGITRLTNDRYQFYKEHYETCIDGYNENSRTARSYGSGLFRYGYETIASTYKQMAEMDLKEMWKYRTAAIVCFCCAVPAAFFGYRFYKKEDADGADQLPGVRETDI